MQRLKTALVSVAFCVILLALSAGATHKHMLTMEPDGSNWQLIFTDPDGIGPGQWSPDMTWIAYGISDSTATNGIARYDTLTGTTCRLNSGQKHWLPRFIDDTTLWYRWHDGAAGGSEYAQLVVDGCAVSQDSLLTGLGPKQTTDFDVSNGLICMSLANDNDGPSGELYLAPMYDLYDRTQLTNNSSNDRYPDISPDETKIAYTHEPALGQTMNIRVIDIDGSNMTQITAETGSSSDLQFWKPLWSPDMSQICYTRKEGSQSDIWIVDYPDTSVRVNITNTPDISERACQWHVNGTILFSADSVGELETTGELLFPTIVHRQCDGDDGCVAQPVMTSASAPLTGATIPVAIPEGMDVCSVSTAGCITEGWDYNYVFDYSDDSGFVFVSLANSTGELLPADTATVFNIHYQASRLCNEDVVWRFDTTLAGDVSRQLLFSDEDHAMVRPDFDAMADSAMIAGYTPGDINEDDIADISDVTELVCYMFQGCSDPCWMNSTDINGDCCGPNIADLVYLIDYMFLGGDAPLCGCLEQGCSHKKLAEAPEVWAEHVDGRTIIHLDSRRILRGVELTLTGQGTAEPTSLLPGNLDLVHGYPTDGELRIGLVDLQGAGTIASGSLAVASIDGEYDIVDAYGADMDGQGVPIVVAANKAQVPQEFMLHQNYPNPFNPTTTISFECPHGADYSLTVYNTLGQVVSQFDGTAQAGENELVWDASSNSSGVYFYKLEIGDYTEMKKMMLLK